MCNHYSSDGRWRDAMGEFSDLQVPLFPNLDRNVRGPDIWPGYTAEIVRPVPGDDGVHRMEINAATWLLVPHWHKGTLKDWRKTRGGCNNAKGETAGTSGIFKVAAAKGRCLIPGDSFFEYAAKPGPDGKKPEYRFTPADDRPFFFAGLCSWWAGSDEDGPQLTYTMVTKPPGAETLSIGHQRQPAILAPDQHTAWLDSANPIESFLEPSPAGTFRVELAPRKAA